MRFKHAILSLGMLVLAGCGSSSGGSSVSDACNELSGKESFSCDTMLVDLVAQGVVPVVDVFAANLVQLNTKMSEYCGEISNQTKLEAAESAWQSVMAPLQQLQVMKFGPNADLDNGLTSFYDWETANPYNIDISIAKNALFGNGLPSSDNEKDLVAIEYVLFAPGEIQTYSDPTKENSNVKDWREGRTGENEIQQDRCDYAMLITDDMESRVATLKSSWEQFGLSSVSSSKQAAANEVAQALFYVDKKTKDLKIKALLPQEGTGSFSANKVESEFAHTSKEHIIENLKGLKAIFTANGNMGLDDYLIAAGQSSVANDMLTTIDAAIANVEAVDDSIFDAVTAASNQQSCITLAASGLYDADETNSSDIDTLCALQYTLKQFTDILKGDFVLTTSFTVPASADGDND